MIRSPGNVLVVAQEPALLYVLVESRVGELVVAHRVLNKPGARIRPWNNGHAPEPIHQRRPAEGAVATFMLQQPGENPSEEPEPSTHQGRRA